MSNLIEPLKNKHGQVKTNVEICRQSYKVLKTLRDGAPYMSQKEIEKNFGKFCDITGGYGDEIMTWLEQINNEPDDERAQKLIQMTLIGKRS